MIQHKDEVEKSKTRTQNNLQESLNKITPLEHYLNSKIRGQEEAISDIYRMAIDHSVGLGYAGKPIGSGLLLGTTGVGKSETVKELSNFYYGDDSGLAIFDMANYQNKEQLPDLIGSSQTNDRGALGKEIERLVAKYNGGILLFDEIEKAHNDIVTIFLSILDDARIRYADGTVHKLDNFWIFMTSNIGSDKMKASRITYTAVKRMILEDAADRMRPELIERFESPIVFRMLDYDTQLDIAKMNVYSHLKHIEKNTGISHIRLDEDTVLRYIIRVGYTREMGARRVKKAAKREINRAVTDLFRTEIRENAEVYLTADKKNGILAEWF